MAAYPGYSGSFFDPVSFAPKPATQTQSTPYGTFTSPNAGQSWTTPQGGQVGDLPGYLQMRGQQVTGSNIQPFQNKLTELLTNPSSVTGTPGYQFALQQGTQAIDRSAAAKGMLNSGNVLQELQKYGSGLASQEYGNQANLLSNALRGAEQFGLSSGYYQKPQTLAPYWSGGALISPKTQVSTW